MGKTSVTSATGLEQQNLEQQPEERIAQLQMENEQLKAKIQWYEEQIRLGKQKQYGASSEKTSAEQLHFTDLLVNEVEMEVDPKREEPTVETITYQRRKTPGQREAKLQNLPVEIIEYHLPAEEQVCPCCNGPLHAMSTEVRQELKVEREIHDASPEERLTVRTERSRLVVDEFLAWLRMQRPRVLPKSTLGGAIAYCLNQWHKLVVFLKDERLELDNNRSERSIKPFVIGRKNWLFSTTPRGGQRQRHNLQRHRDGQGEWTEPSNLSDLALRGDAAACRSQRSGGVG